MNPFAIISLFSFMTLTVIGIALFLRNPKSWTNRLASALIGAYAVQVFIEFGYRQAQSAVQANFWWGIDTVWPLGVVANVYFVIVFIERATWLRRFFVHALICIPAFAAIAVEVLTDYISGAPKEYFWGWSYSTGSHSHVAHAAYLWNTAVCFICLVLVAVYFLRQTDPGKRQGAKLVLFAEIAGFVSVLGDMMVPYLDYEIPPLNGVYLILVSLILGYAILRHDLFALTPITVAENIVTAMADSLLLVNTKFRIEATNDAALRMLEYRHTDLFQAPVEKIFAKNVVKPKWFASDIRDDESEMMEYFDTRFVSSTGKRIPVWLASSALLDANGRKLGYLMIARDITERNRREQELKVFKNHLEKLVAERTSELEQSLEDLKKESDQRVRVEKERENLAEQRDSLEKQLYHAQKLESIGRLAGGVAHDFNNLLFVINTYSEGFLNNLDKRDPLFHDFQEIHRAATRATSLTQQLLAFSRKQISSPQVIDPNEAINQLQRMLERLIGEHIYINVVPGINVGNIRIDPGQLDQVMMNLAVNARDAMPSGGTITIEINKTVVHRSEFHERDSVRPGSYVIIRFSDNGTGMDENTKSKIFDPFFSTKAPGKGTGLGLSTIYGIVKQNGGLIDVDSALGIGTTFTLYFPSYESDIEDDLLPGTSATLEGSETILLVEDEDQVRRLAARLLRQLGYNVIEASSASEATVVFHECRNDIDLLFTDIVMPGMNGKQLSRLLGVTKPKLKVLFMSGYNEEISDNMGQLDPETAFIAKPFSSNDLSVKIREVLDGTR